MSDKMREALEKIVKVVENTHSSTFGLDLNQVHVIAETVLTQQPESEPVYQCLSRATGGWHDVPKADYEKMSQYRECRMLYVSPQPSAQVPTPLQILEFIAEGGKQSLSTYDLACQLHDWLSAAPSIAEKREDESGTVKFELYRGRQGFSLCLADGSGGHRLSGPKVTGASLHGVFEVDYAELCREAKNYLCRPEPPEVQS